MPPAGPDLEALLQVKQKLSDRYLPRGLEHGVLAMHPTSIPEAAARAGNHVHAVGIGRKVVDGRKTDIWCIRVFVIQKVDPERPEDFIPPEIDGVPTDVIPSAPAYLAAPEDPVVVATEPATGEDASGFVALALATCSSRRQQRQDPIPCGFSTGRNGGDPGTIACFCRSTAGSNDILVLSNNHIFVNPAGGATNLFQPAPGDGLSQLHFADLHDFVPLAPGAAATNEVDAAVGRLRPGVTHDTDICTIGAVAGTLPPSEDLPVRKHGRTTGLRNGSIHTEICDCLIGFDPLNPASGTRFVNQIRIEGSGNGLFATFGDSGSLVVHRDSRAAVGLLFAVSNTDDYAYANPIGRVLSLLGISIL
jgi:hypothetical protein